MKQTAYKWNKGTFGGDRSIERNKTNSFKSSLIVGYSNHCSVCGHYAGDDYDKSYLEAHHIKRIADGGKTNYGNVVMLCPTCHEKAHRGLISIATLRKHTISDDVVLGKLQCRIERFRTISENKTLKQGELFQ